MIGLILQARMSSKRLPGKVMTLIDGKPLLLSVIEQCKLAHQNGPIIVCTSKEKSDDIIFEFCRLNDIEVFRGSLDDVYSRYLGCIKKFRLTAFGRICCDSPGISADLIRLAIEIFEAKEAVDLVSNVCVRSFPVGQSIEIVNAQTFNSVKFRESKGFSKEHVTQSFYKDSVKYKIFNIENNNSAKPMNWAVDEPGDLERVSKLLKAGFFYDKTAITINKWEN